MFYGRMWEDGPNPIGQRCSANRVTARPVDKNHTQLTHANTAAYPSHTSFTLGPDSERLMQYGALEMTLKDKTTPLLATMTCTAAASSSADHEVKSSSRVLVVLMPWEWRGPEDYAVRSCTFNAALRPEVDIVALPDSCEARAAWAALRSVLTTIMDWQAVWYAPALPTATQASFDSFENWRRALLALADNGWVRLEHTSDAGSPAPSTRGLSSRHTVASGGIPPATPSTRFHQQIEQGSIHATKLCLPFPFRDDSDAGTDGSRIPAGRNSRAVGQAFSLSPSPLSADGSDAIAAKATTIAIIGGTEDPFPGSEPVVQDCSSTDSADDGSRRSESPGSWDSEPLPILMPRYVDYACLHALVSLGADCRVFGDEWHVAKQKEWIHPVVPSRAAYIMDNPLLDDSLDLSMNPESARDCGLVAGVHLPRGFRCYNRAELLEGFSLLQVQGVKRIVLKPGQGASGGRGIILNVKLEDILAIHDDGATARALTPMEPVLRDKAQQAGRIECPGKHRPSPREAQQALGPAQSAGFGVCALHTAPSPSSAAISSAKPAISSCTRRTLLSAPRAKLIVWSLEEMVDVALHAGHRASVISPAVHLIGDEVSLPRTEQLIFGEAEFFGSVAPPRVAPALMDACEATMRAVQRKLRLRGFWGADFLVDRSTGLALLTDLNVGRPNGAHPAKMALAVHAPGAEGMVFFKFHCPASLSWQEVVALWRREAVLFRQPDVPHETVAVGVIPVAIAVGGVSLGLALAGCLEDAEAARDAAMRAIGGHAC